MSLHIHRGWRKNPERENQRVAKETRSLEKEAEQGEQTVSSVQGETPTETEHPPNLLAQNQVKPTQKEKASLGAKSTERK